MSLHERCAHGRDQQQDNEPFDEQGRYKHVVVQSKLCPPSRAQEDCYYYMIWQHHDGRRIKFERGITHHDYSTHMAEVGWCQMCAGEIEHGDLKGAKWATTTPHFYTHCPKCDTCRDIAIKRNEIQQKIAALEHALKDVAPWL